MFANLGFAAVLQSTHYPRAGREALWICTTATLQQRSPSEASFLSYLTIQLTCHPGRFGTEISHNQSLRSFADKATLPWGRKSPNDSKLLLRDHLHRSLS